MTARAFLVIAILSVTGAGASWLTRPEADVPRAPLSELATSIDGWTSTSLPIETKIIEALGVDDHISRVYQHAGRAPVSLYVGYYRTQRTGETIHSPLKCLPGTGWQPIETGTISMDVTDAAGRARSLLVNRYIVQKGLDRHIVFFWYQMQGRVVTSEYVAKLYLIDGAVRTNRTDGALVRVIVPVDDADSDAAADETAKTFVRLLIPKLAAHLPA